MGGDLGIAILEVRFGILNRTSYFKKQCLWGETAWG